MRMWGSVVELLKNQVCPAPANRRRPWMEDIKETLFDFSKNLEGEDEEDEKANEMLEHAQQHALTTGSPASSVNRCLSTSAHSFVPISQPATRGEACSECEEGPNGLADRVNTLALEDHGVGPLDLRRLESIKITADVVKWYRNADPRLSELFLCRLRQLAAGDRSKILSKRLVGSKTFAIFETYLDQAHTAQRIVFTEIRERNGLAGILIWYVSKHKHVSRCMKQIDDTDARQNRQPKSARSLFGHENSDVMLLDEDTVLLDPMANTPLKIHDTDVHMLGSKECLDSLPLRLTSAEKTIVQKSGTVLVLGRAGTGKTICIANKMSFDRQRFVKRDGGDGVCRQLFVARSPRICRLVGSLQGSLCAPPCWMQEGAVGSLSGENGSEVLLQTLEQVLLHVADSLELNREFIACKRVDYTRFKNEIFPLIRGRLKTGAGLDALVLWTSIRSFIKGSIEAVVGIDDKGQSNQENAGMPINYNTFVGLGVNRMRLSQAQRHEAFEAATVVAAIYKEQTLWDDADLVLAVHGGLERMRHENMLNGSLEQTNHCRMFYKVYMDEVQDLTSAELALLLHMSTSRSLFLAGDPAQSVTEGVDFRFDEVCSVFHHMTGKAPDKPLTLNLNFRSHTGILEAAGAILDWLFHFFPGSCQRLPTDEGLCKGPRPGVAFWNMDQVNHVLHTQIDTGLVFLTPDHNLAQLKSDLGITEKQAGFASVFGIRDAKGLDFPEVVIVDFFKSLDQQQQKSWKAMLASSPPIVFHDEHPEVETHLKLLYTAMTRAQRRLNFIETTTSKAACAFFRALQRDGKLVELASLANLETYIMSSDEWVSRGLDFAWEATSSGCLAAGGSLAQELLWIERALECFLKAGSGGLVYARKAHVHRDVLCLHPVLLFDSLSEGPSSPRGMERDGQKSVDTEVVHRWDTLSGGQRGSHDRTTSCSGEGCARGSRHGFVTEGRVVQLVAGCIAEDMWLEAHSLVALIDASSLHAHHSTCYQHRLETRVLKMLRK